MLSLKPISKNMVLMVTGLLCLRELLPGRIDNDIKDYRNKRLKKTLLGKKQKYQIYHRKGDLLMKKGISLSEIPASIVVSGNENEQNQKTSLVVALWWCASASFMAALNKEDLDMNRKTRKWLYMASVVAFVGSIDRVKMVPSVACLGGERFGEAL
ncbi:hypothetical protein L1987_38840 [Smallanthus sonchifolius]|uniref:Uncharacterized protein n=1 Tax=Smallanthus sonchifolius TaxID=185202 RepID=A0ACB9HM50_9ASTR|nr:hypothetical protein L1987_38840 [Smallanthus sonchifolius]